MFPYFYRDKKSCDVIAASAVWRHSCWRFRLHDLLVTIPSDSSTRAVNPFFPTVPTCAVRETASLGIMGPNWGYCSQPIFSHRSNICCPRDCVSRHNGGTSGAPLKPLRVDSYAERRSLSDSKCWRNRSALMG